MRTRHVLTVAKIPIAQNVYGAVQAPELLSNFTLALQTAKVKEVISWSVCPSLSPFFPKCWVKRCLCESHVVELSRWNALLTWVADVHWPFESLRSPVHLINWEITVTLVTEIQMSPESMRCTCNLSNWFIAMHWSPEWLRYLDALVALVTKIRLSPEFLRCSGNLSHWDALVIWLMVIHMSLK